MDVQAIAVTLTDHRRDRSETLKRSVVPLSQVNELLSFAQKRRSGTFT